VSAAQDSSSRRCSSTVPFALAKEKMQWLCRWDER
jgi:hypothetical protein